MDEQTEKSCWGVTFWAVTLVVAFVGLITLASNVDVAENDDVDVKPAAVAAAG